MDEIIIEDKKYVSSKRAAKITGYAKDYVGQLCREGRVPARLVGRSWYVLESAIQDHRFGSDTLPEEETASATAVQNTWEAPRYEAMPVETLSVHQEGIASLEASDTENEKDPPKDHHTNVQDVQEIKNSSDISERPKPSPEALQESWRAWFDRVVEQTSSEPTVPLESNLSPTQEMNVAETRETPLSIDIGEEEIPIRTIYNLPPKDLLPKYEVENEYEKESLSTTTEEVQTMRSSKKGIGRIIILPLLLIAIATTILAFLNVGILDKTLDSFNQATVITGISSYNK